MLIVPVGSAGGGRIKVRLMRIKGGVAVPQLSPELSDDSPAVRVTTIATAGLPVHPIAPNTRLLTALGLAVGGVVGLVYAVVRLLLARRVSNPASLQGLTDIPLLGQIVPVQPLRPGVGAGRFLAVQRLLAEMVAHVLRDSGQAGRPGAN